MADTSVITLARRINLARATSGVLAPLPPITHIAFGDGGVDADDQPIMPTADQTSLKHEVGRYPIDTPTFPVPTTVAYTAEIPESDLVGTRLSEMGLVDADGTLCAIKTMYIKQKDDGVKLIFEMNDEF